MWLRLSELSLIDNVIDPRLWKLGDLFIMINNKERVVYYLIEFLYHTENYSVSY